MSDFNVISHDEKKALVCEIENLKAQMVGLVISEAKHRSSLNVLTRKTIYDSFGACVFCNTHKSFGCRADCDFVRAKELAESSITTPSAKGGE